MKKLKIKKTTNLLNYQQFLKNNYFKKHQFKLKNILFENHVLYNNLNLESSVIEFNNYKNIYLPLTSFKKSEISTIALKYKNVLLFNYDLTFNIIYQFNKIMFKNILPRKNNIIKGRVLDKHRNHKKIYISILGCVFSIKPVNLHNLFFKKREYYIKKKKFFINQKEWSKKKKFFNKLFLNYKFRYLNFQIINKNNEKLILKKKLSRTLYVETLRKNRKIIQKKLKKKKRSKKSVLSKKVLRNKINI